VDPDPTNLAEAIRSVRESKKLSIRGLAQDAGVSPSLLSRVERSQTDPSLATVRAVARALDVPVAELFVAREHRNGEGSEPAGRDARDGTARRPSPGVVAPDQRKQLHLPATGLKYELLSPDLQGQIEFLWSEFAEGQPETDFASHVGEEAILVLEGTMEVFIEDEVHVLGPGYSITYDASRPHRVHNPGPGVTIAVTVITPPSF